MSNEKYEITDIAHERYPWLHRIRALRQIRENVVAGDIGGFVEFEKNLDTDSDDSSWIYDNAIACGNAFVNEDSIVYGGAIVRDNAYITKKSSLSGRAVVMEDAMVQTGFVLDEAVVAGNGMVLERDGYSPIVRNGASVFGRVYGNILIDGEASVITENEVLGHLGRDTLCIKNGKRSVERLHDPRELTQKPTQRIRQASRDDAR